MFSSEILGQLTVVEEARILVPKCSQMFRLSSGVRDLDATVY